jgi:hypothetical protein
MLMKRTLLLGTAWTASAAAAVGLGFLAVTLVDASASPGGAPLVAAATASGTETPAPTATATTASGTKATEAGIVSASCGSRSLAVSGAPAAGWWVDDSSDPGGIQFEDGTHKLEVQVTCVDGSPRFAVEGPRADTSGGGGSPTTAPASTDAPDDSDGRVGGGHGSDDPAGDDSSGRSGGGHGSDDSGSGHGGSDDSGGHGSDD